MCCTKIPIIYYAQQYRIDYFEMFIYFIQSTITIVVRKMAIFLHMIKLFGDNQILSICSFTAMFFFF